MGSIADRSLRTLAPAAASAILLSALSALLALAGCATGQPASLSESQLGHNRTFSVAFGAMKDQKLVIGQQDVRTGIIVGTDAGVSITARLDELPSGAIRVTFRAEPEGANPALLKRVIDAYNARMAQFGVLSSFKGDGGGDGGPVPCPGGPAFCK
jgi:hypothetical protein